MTEPIPFKVTRYRCPHCPRTASRPVRIREHMTRCWQNPAAKGCKTCKHFDPYDAWSDNESCKVGIDLSGRPQCKTCGGFGDVPGEDLGMTECPDCAGDGAEIKPGPIVHCDLWEIDPEYIAPVIRLDTRRPT